jgi:hypothetical protein
MSIKFGSTNVKIKHQLTESQTAEVRSSKYKHLVENFKQFTYEQTDHVGMAVKIRVDDCISYHW